MDGKPSPHKKQKMYTGEMKAGEPARTLGAPRFHTHTGGYKTEGGIYVDCQVTPLEDPEQGYEMHLPSLRASVGPRLPPRHNTL